MTNVNDISINMDNEVDKEIVDKLDQYIAKLNAVKEYSTCFNPTERGIILAMSDLIKSLVIDNAVLRKEMHELINLLDEKIVVNREVLLFSQMSMMVKNRLDMLTPNEYVQSVSDEMFKITMENCPSLFKEDGPYGNLIEIRNQYLEEPANNQTKQG